MIEGKSFYFHGTVVTIRTQEQRMKNQSNYNRQSEQREICEKKKKETRRYNHDMKNRSYHYDRQSEQKEICETKLIIIQSKNMQTASSAGRRESPSRYWF